TLLQSEAEIRWRQGDASGALRSSLAAQRQSLPHIRTVVQALPRDQALAFAAERRQSIDLALQVAADAPLQPPQRVAEAWEVAADSRMLVFNAEADRQRLLRAASDPQLAAAAARLSAARERFAYLLVQTQPPVQAHGSPLRAARRDLQEAEAAFAAQ